MSNETSLTALNTILIFRGSVAPWEEGGGNTTYSLPISRVEVYEKVEESVLQVLKRVLN